MQAISDCQSNGVIKATLSGPGITNGNIELSDAKYSITSLTSSYTQPPIANNGIIVNVPPGSYQVVVQAYCKATYQWITQTSNTVIVTGSYVVPDINKIYVATDGIVKSLKCGATGSIPIKMEGGKGPYTIKMVNAPAGYSGPTTFTQPIAGVHTIPNLPAGPYEFEVSDDCTYTLSNIKATVDEITPSFSIGTITNTTCTNDGAIPIILKDGAVPYTVEVTGFPAGYTGETSFTLTSDGTLNLTNLPIGNYSFKVSDKCYTKNLTAKVNELPLQTSIQGIKSSYTCESTGSITVKYSGGRAPYSIKLEVTSGSYTPTVTNVIENTAGQHIFNGLPEGDYKVTLEDACGNKATYSAQHVSATKLSASANSIVNARGCGGSGRACINVQGGKAPYRIKLVSTTAVGYTNPTPLTVPAATSCVPITSMNPGDYKFEVEDDCGVTKEVDITIGKEDVAATALQIRKSFEFLGTGILSITVTGGDPPYSVVMNSYPPGYAGAMSGFQPTNPNGGVFKLYGLIPGEYCFTITDTCGNVANVCQTIDKVPYELPGEDGIGSGGYNDYMQPPNTPSGTCDRINISRIKNLNVNHHLANYWNVLDSAKRYYEVAYQEKGDSGPLNWQTVVDVKDTTLSMGYCAARAANHYFVVHVRVKGDVAELHGVQTDTVRIGPVKTNMGAPYNQSCSGFNIKFSQYKDYRGLFCYPYTWTLINAETGIPTTIQGGPIPNANEQTVTNIPSGKYVFKFTDKEGCSWYSDTIRGYWSQAPTTNIQTTLFCPNYEACFTISTLCPPYGWELIDKLANTVIDSRTNMQTVDTTYCVANLTYEKEYELKVYYKAQDKDETKTFRIHEIREKFYNYTLGNVHSYCLPDTAKGSIFVERSATMPAFEKGTVIAFVSGPSLPVHDTITIDTTNITRVYPFSTDSLTLAHVDLLPGTYSFKLTDTCGFVHSLSINYEKLSLKDFGYVRDTICSGMRVLPHGTLYLGNTPLPTYFRIAEAPQDIAVDPTSVTSSGYLFIAESGHYVIQVSSENSPTSCPYDTLSVDFIKQSVALDAEATQAYVCKKSDDGYIRIQHVGGVGPFEYELFDKGVSKGSSTTGIFNYGKSGETYTIRIKDKGCHVSFDQNITLINLTEERLIYGAGDICYGGRIELNSVPFESKGYRWTGPNNFISYSKNTHIDNVTFDNEGIYTLSVEPDGCNGAIQQTLEATIIKPRPPFTDSVSIMCLNSAISALSAEADPEHYLKWYAPNGTTVMSAAPIPPTSKADTLIYFVSQVYTRLGCESDKVPAMASISDLPRAPLAVLGSTVCPNMYPTVSVPNSNEFSIYTIFDSFEGGLPLGSAVSAGDTLVITSTVPLPEGRETYFVEVSNQYGCTGLVRKPADVVAKNYLYISPTEIPPYKRGKMYSVQLQSNGVSPYTFSGTVPLGFTLSASGLISGMGPVNERFDPMPFDVTLVDANGCVAENPYLLKSEPFVPQVFTPNGDGTNDHFMKGMHVIIFDRLGIIIFEGNDGWDGTRKGKPAPPDTYFYLLDYDDDGVISKKKGYITLMR